MQENQFGPGTYVQQGVVPALRLSGWQPSQNTQAPGPGRSLASEE